MQLTLPGGTEPVAAHRGTPRRDPGPAHPGGRPAADAPPAPPSPEHPPVILQLGLHDFAVLEWVRDEDGEPVYRIVRQGIKAAKIAATLARKLARNRGKEAP